MADTNITMTTAGGVRLETEGTYVDTDIVVAPDSTSQTNLTAENIKEGVSILGVTGTLSAEPGADGKTPVLTQSTINFIPSTTQNGQFTIGADVEVGDPIIIACKGIGTYEGRTWVVVGSVMSFASTSHVAIVDVTGVTETTGEQGPQGQAGAAGVGVPSGGTTGQVLKKASNTPYDTEWADESGGIDSTTGGDTNFSTVSNIVTTTQDSPDASSLPEGTLVIKIAS